MPSAATPRRTAVQFIRDLSGGIPPQWSGATVGISLWRCARTADEIDPAARIALATGAPPPPLRQRWLDLSPCGWNAVRAPGRGRRAPLAADWHDRLYLPSTSARVLAADADATDGDLAADTYALVLRTLLRALPAIPAQSLRDSSRVPLLSSAPHPRDTWI